MAGKNPYNIQIRQSKVGKDLTFLITGGEPHIGGVATAFWVDDKIQVTVTELPHHKEGELAKECAETAARELGITVSVIMGIHIDNATKKEIEDIVQYVRKEMKEEVRKYKN